MNAGTSLSEIHPAPRRVEAPVECVWLPARPQAGCARNPGVIAFFGCARGSGRAAPGGAGQSGCESGGGGKGTRHTSLPRMQVEDPELLGGGAGAAGLLVRGACDNAAAEAKWRVAFPPDSQPIPAV